MIAALSSSITSEMKINPNVLSAIESELDRAEGIHPDYPTDPVRRAAILAEEAGEVVRAALDLTRPHKRMGYTAAGLTQKMYKEAVHTAAMAVRLLNAMEGDK